MSIKWRVLWIIAFILVSCQSPSRAVGLALTQPVITQQETLAQGLEPVSSATPAPSMTSNVTATGLNIQERCISISSPPENIKIEGTIVLLDHQGQSVVLIGEHEVQIPDEYHNTNGNSYQSVSPDRSFLLYRQIESQPTKTASLRVAASDGSVVFEFHEDNYQWLPGIDWFSDEYIRYPLQSKEDDEQLNLFALKFPTGEMQELRTDFPNMVNGDLIDWGIDTWSIYGGVKKGVNVIYDPSLNLAVYPKMRNDYPKKGQRIYLASLYDVQNNVELAEVHFAGSDRPAWSPNGKYFTILGIDPVTRYRDIYIVTRAGDTFTPLTNLGERYPKGAIGTYSWSADSQHIAFWHKEVEQEIGENDYNLLLFDLASKEMTDLCIKGNSVSAPLGYNSSFNLRGKPIWSPDGTKLLVTQYDHNTQDAVDLLIDLKNEVAYPVATNLEPAGWLK